MKTHFPKVAIAVASCLLPSCEREKQSREVAARVEAGAAVTMSQPQKPAVEDSNQPDGVEQAKAIRERLDRVAEIANRLCQSDITVMLSETGRGGMATGVGIVRIDFTVASKISEDALAGLIAHEFAHEVLGHVQELTFLGPQNRRLPSRMQQMRELERRADAFAGWVLAQTDYDPNAFEELLKLGPDTAWVDPLMRSYYPTHDRMRVLLESYESAKSGGQAADRTSQEVIAQESMP